MNEKSALLDLFNTWIGAGGSLLASVIGRLMWHTNEVRKQRRNFWGPEMIWEVPVVLGMWIIGIGVGTYFKLGYEPTTALCACLAYLGPRGAEVLFNKWFFRDRQS